MANRKVTPCDQRKRDVDRFMDYMGRYERAAVARLDGKEDHLGLYIKEEMRRHCMHLAPDVQEEHISGMVRSGMEKLLNFSLTPSRMDRWNGRIALVTGASAGIGAAICRELVKYGMIVVGCARNFEKIEELAKEDGVLISRGRIHPIKCDLTVESDILKMFDEIRQKYGRIDVCINNAGFSTDSPLLTGETSDWRKMLEVNVLALCICNREALKIMQEKGINDGQIVNISSLGGHRVKSSSQMMGVHFYCGTKFMVRALTEGLRREVKGMNGHIRVASISPGLVETEFLPRLFEGNQEKSDAVLTSLDCLQARDIAESVVYILKMPPYVDINDIIMRPVQQAD